MPLAILLSLLSLLQSHAAAQPSAPAVYVPERVYDSRRAAFSDFEAMLADLAKADVVFVGEQHDDPNTHRLEAAILDGLNRRGAPVTLSLEMFERDVQGKLDAYLTGSVEEEAFLQASRPWPRYATDYRPLVELARSQRWPVVASNVPRKYASAVAKSGAGGLESLTSEEGALVAADLQCPHDRYFERFAESMNSHPVPGTEKLSEDERRATTDRYYVSQCVKDETMAESIAAAFDRRFDQRPIVHFNGAFHSDFGQGTAERARRRLPGRRVVIVSILPVKDLDTLAPAGEDLTRADYLVYTVK
jgi:uncharacterized iron-regulated protein